jgi:hypothetical protein
MEEVHQFFQTHQILELVKNLVTFLDSVILYRGANRVITVHTLQPQA